MESFPFANLLARVQFWRITSLVACLAVFIFLALGVGLYASRMSRSVKEKAVVRSVRKHAELMARKIGQELAKDPEASLTEMRDRLGKDMVEHTTEELGAIYVHCVDETGRIVWSTREWAGERNWPGGVPAHFLSTPEHRNQLRTPGPGEMTPWSGELTPWPGKETRDAFIEVVCPIEGEPSPGAIVAGVSEVRVSEQIRRELWVTMGLAGVAGTLALGTVLLAHYLLTRRAVELMRLREREEQLAQLGLLASGLAHEIRNPLNAMRFALQSLRTRAARTEPSPAHQEMTEIIDEIGGEVDGLNRIVTSFLSYARPGGETPEECDVNQICLAAIAISAPELEKHGVEGLTHLPRPPLRTRTFPGRLRQVLVNLIHNAAQACGPGHRVTIHGSQRGRTLRISVEDDGPGLPDEIRSHLFEPFHTSRKDGTGLGLAICHRLISDMNGKITYEPARPRGSVFILEIPSVPGDEKAGPRTK